MIKYIKGDALQTHAELIAHGCNCRGAFGYGIAGQITKVYPKAQEAYLKKYKAEGWNLGEVQVVPVGANKFIANCATQKNYGSPKGGKIYVDYKAIEVVMIELKRICEENSWTLAMPKIGAGLAGGDWNKIEEIINKTFPNTEVLVYVF